MVQIVLFLGIGFCVGWVAVDYYWMDGAVITYDGELLTVAIPNRPTIVRSVQEPWLVEGDGYAVAVGYNRAALCKAALLREPQDDLRTLAFTIVFEFIIENKVTDQEVDREIARLANLHAVDLTPIVRVGVAGVRVKKIDISGIVLVLVECTQTLGGADITVWDGAEVVSYLSEL